MKATIIQQAPLRLIVAKSTKFPEGNSSAFEAIESRLKSLRGRRFYGLAYETEQGMDYYAGLVADNEMEERSFVELGYQLLEIEGGACARIKLREWSSKLDQLGPTFKAMIAEYGRDSSRPQMEFYRSSRELHLLLPIPSLIARRRPN